MTIYSFKTMTAPFWLTPCERKQTEVLTNLDFEFVPEIDLMEDLDLSNAIRINDWDFMIDLDEKPDEFDDYPLICEHQIYAHCNDAVYLLYISEECADLEEALEIYNSMNSIGDYVKSEFSRISKEFLRGKQLCLIN